MEPNSTSDATQGNPIIPESNPVVIYGFLGRLAYRADYDGVRAGHVFRRLWKEGHRRSIKCGEGYFSLTVVPAEPEGFRAYIAKTADGCAVGKVTVSCPYFGMVAAERVEAEPGRGGVLEAVFREIGKDAVRMGARLLPAPPGCISEEELKVWWEVDRLLVAYYDECGSLGLTVEGEEAEDLEHLRHLIPVLKMQHFRERMLNKRGKDAVAFIENIGRLLTEAGKAGCRNAGDMASWLNRNGVTARRGSRWTENSVRDVGRDYEKLGGTRVLSAVGRH